MSNWFKPVDNVVTVAVEDIDGATVSVEKLEVKDEGVCFTEAPTTTSLKRDAATAAIVLEVGAADILEVDT